MLLWILTSVSMAQAAVITQTYQLPVNANDIFVFQGVRAHVKVTTQTGASKVKLQVKYKAKTGTSGQDWPEGESPGRFSFRRVDHQLVAKVESELSKSVLRNSTLKRPVELYELEVLMPAIPAHIFVHTGKIHANQLKSAFEFTLQKGQVRLNQGKGSVKGFIQSGDVVLENHQGNVRLEAYQANTTVSQLKGDLTLDNFVGKIKIDQIDGTVVKLKSFKGRVLANNIKSRVEFNLLRTPLNLTGLKGDLRGQSEQGRIAVKTVGETNIRIRTVDAPVQIQAMKSGARVNLGSEKGQIYAPSYLRLNNYGGLKVKTGRLRGSQLGHIFVRTTNGNIRIN